MRSHFIAVFQSVRKDKELAEKNEEILMKLWALVSRKRLEQFALNLVCKLTYLAGIPAANLVAFG